MAAEPIVLLNFATPEYFYSQDMCNVSAQSHGIESILSFGPDTFAASYPRFFRENPDFSENDRGYAYWLWKPYLIHEILKTLPDGSCLIYCDAGVILSASPDPLVRILEKQNQVFFNMPEHANKEWTKRDTFAALDTDTEECRNAWQAKSQFHLWKKCAESLQRSAEWYRYCRIKHLIDDSPSVEPNDPDFVAHRHDQSVLSLLVYKWNVEIHRDPTQEGLPHFDKFPNSNYPMLAAAVGKQQKK